MKVPLICTRLGGPFLIIVVGRRRIGKSYMMTQIAEDLYKQGYPVLYLDLPFDISLSLAELERQFVTLVANRMEQFDKNICMVHPNHKFAQIMTIDLLGWLLKSGVVVIIDEFQNLQKFASAFQV